VHDDAVRLLGNVSGKRVLELGFGDDVAAFHLADQGARVIAVDHRSSRIAAVREVAEQETVAIDLRATEDLAELAFLRAETIDAVYSGGSFDEVEDLDRVLRQVHRVLRSDAILVFTLPHPASAGLDYFGERTIGALFASLTRNNFRIDALLEPDPVLVIRARKEGR
jgi:ubiquinone/menaquinone biosynthesis C-methylase UbiE